MAVRQADSYTLGQYDRTEYIRSQMAAYPEYADRIAEGLFSEPGKYPVFHRERIEDGYEIAPNREGVMVQWAKFKPGPVQFDGWMTPEEYEAWQTARTAAREAANDG